MSRPFQQLFRASEFRIGAIGATCCLSCCSFQDRASKPVAACLVPVPTHQSGEVPDGLISTYFSIGKLKKTWGKMGGLLCGLLRRLLPSLVAVHLRSRGLCVS